jgi:outer membrane protein
MSNAGLVRRSWTALPCLVAAWATMTSEALAQPAQPPAPAPQPAPEPKTEPADELGPGEAAIRQQADPLAALLAPDPAGLTYEQVAREAVVASTSVRSKEIEVESAEGAVSQTLVSFFPRVTLSASYTRLSEVALPTLGGGGFSVVSQAAGPIGVAPCAGNPAAQCAVDSAGNPVQAVDTSFSFPQVLNQIAFSGNVTVPISDYFLRAVQAYNGAEANEESLRLQVEAQKLTVSAEAKLALIGWALSKGQTAVATQSSESAKNQLRDVNAALSADKAAKVDVLRIEALVAQSEYTVAEAQSNEFVAEQRLRTLLRVRSDRPLTVGIDLLGAPAIPELGSVDVLFDEAVANRLELIATEKSRQALEEAASATRATYWPRLDAFADILIANPNQRVFPQREQFDTTWDVGVRLTWVINDTFSTIGAEAQANARSSQVESTKLQIMDAIRLEVTSAHGEMMKARASIEAANRGVVAAEETLRVSKKVFALGSITGTTLADQENALTTARLRKLSAYASLQSALIRLEHATGRDRRAPLAPTRAAVGE